jgi:hypothetical protein
MELINSIFLPFHANLIWIISLPAPPRVSFSLCGFPVLFLIKKFGFYKPNFFVAIQL